MQLSFPIRLKVIVFTQTGTEKVQVPDDTDDPEMLPESGEEAEASFGSDSEEQQSEAAFFSGSSDEDGIHRWKLG